MTTYSGAGVDLDAADRHVAAISDVVTATWTERVIGGFGGFAAGVEIPSGYHNPVLMMSTDGVGTKLELARRSHRWSGVGHDLVAMCVDDLAAAGARPIGFVDYLVVESLQPVRDTAIVASIAAACSLAGCPLLGGETAVHPGLMDPGAVDLAGAAMGVVEKGEELGPHRVHPGDLVVGLASPGLRSNGFSLVRRLFEEETPDGLLDPAVIYSPAVMDAVAGGGVHSAAHITGGGLEANLARAIPDGLTAAIHWGSWSEPDVFGLIRERGVDEPEMRRTFNLGIGFCLLVGPDAADEVMSVVSAHSPLVIGEVSAA